MPQPRFRFDRPEKELSEVETLTVDELLSNEIQTQKIRDEVQRREIPSELWKGLAGERAGILRRRGTAASCAAPLEKAKRRILTKLDRARSRLYKFRRASPSARR